MHLLGFTLGLDFIVRQWNVSSLEVKFLLCIRLFAHAADNTLMNVTSNIGQGEDLLPEDEQK